MKGRRSLEARAACVGALLTAATVACQPEAGGGVTSAPVSAPSTPGAAPASIHALTMRGIDGAPMPLSAYAGKVVLVVNTASECGYTPQYEGLQDLHERYESRGFAVLAFPSNDFGGQEPGSSEQIASFCKSRYGVAFPLFDKVKTKGADRAELYAMLSNALGPPEWNFHKYLVDKRGFAIRAFPSAVAPESAELTKAIEAALAAP